MLQDVVLNIYTVPEPFPSGFICQEVDEVETAMISGAAHVNYQVKTWLQQLKENNKELETVLKDSEVARKQAQMACQATYKSFESKLSSPESGGLQIYIKKFLTRGCVHVMREENE